SPPSPFPRARSGNAGKSAATATPDSVFSFPPRLAPPSSPLAESPPMSRVFVYLLYNLLLPFVLLLGLPSFLIKGLRRGGLARNCLRRLGFLPGPLLERLRGRRPIWIHAVSVGEVFIALKLVEALRSAAPERALV